MDVYNNNIIAIRIRNDNKLQTIEHEYCQCCFHMEFFNETNVDLKKLNI